MNLLVRNAWKLGFGLLAAGILTARGATQLPVHLQQHVLATTSDGPTTVACGNLQPTSGSDVVWTAAHSPYILPANDPNLPTNDPAHPNCLKPDPNNAGAFIGDDVYVPVGTRLIIDGSLGPVQIFSHGTGIIANGGQIQSLGSVATDLQGHPVLNTISFDAEPDVASWDGIRITTGTDSHNATILGNGSFSYTSIQHALTAIAIDSGSTALTGSDGKHYGLVVANSGIGPSYFDGIDSTNTPVEMTGQADGRFGTINNIGSQAMKITFDSTQANYPTHPLESALSVRKVVFGSSVPFADSSCVPLQPCAAGTIGNDAILGTFAVGQTEPVTLAQNAFFRAGSFGAELNNANAPTITDNGFTCNGSGSPKPVVTCAGTGTKYSALYLNNVTGDLATGINNNVGQQNGLDAIVMNGLITSNVQWKTPTNDPSSLTAPHALGYLVANGDLELANGKKLTVGDGDVVKVKGGAIKLDAATLDASSNGAKTFTSLRDNSIGIAACPSVFVTSCLAPLPPGEWTGISMGSGSDASINNASILYATTGVQAVNGASHTVDTTYGSGFGLVMTNSKIGPSFADGVSASGTPIALVNDAFTCPAGVCANGLSAGNHGVLVDFSGQTGPLGSGLRLDHNSFSGTINEAIKGVALTHQTVFVNTNVVQGAGIYGIQLQNATNPTVTSNVVTGSGTGTPTYPAIYLPGVDQADFNSAISGNTGSRNGLDAIAFHGATGTNKSLSWLTISNSVTNGPLGYLADGAVVVNGDLTFPSGAYAPVLGGSITVAGGKLTATNAVITSLKESALNIPTCGSIFAQKISGLCPAKLPGDWGGLVLDATQPNALTGSEIRYAGTGITLGAPSGIRSAPALSLNQTSIRNVTSDAINSKSPVSIIGGAFTNAGGHGIKVDLTGVSPNVNQPLALSGHPTISGTGLEGILASSLAGHAVNLQDVAVDRTGAYGIKLEGADNLTLLRSTVTNAASGFSAIYLNGIKNADFNNAIKDNKGAGNGLDALVFHGDVSGSLNWITARKTADPTRLLGYAVDGDLNMTAGTLTVKAGDIVKVGNGGTINLTSVGLDATDTSTASQKVFTSLADNTAGVQACPSAFLPGCTVATTSDWGGLNLTSAGANGSLVNASLRYATTGINITSGNGATFGTSLFGLNVSRSRIGPVNGDAIASVSTPLSVTDSVISAGAHGVNLDFAGATSTAALRLSGNQFSGTGAEAIAGQSLAGHPVWITDNRVQAASSFGIRLLNADALVLRNNNISASGGGPLAMAGRYPAIYLSRVTGDFAHNIRGNVGSGNGLDAIVMDGIVNGNLNWVTVHDLPATHALGYLFDGGVTLQGGDLTVNAGDVVKTLGGPITLNGGSLKADAGITTRIFTSFKDDPGSLVPLTDTGVSCPSVFVSVCNPSPGDWGGLTITDDTTGHRGNNKLANAEIRFAGTGIAIDSGPITSAESGAINYRLTVFNTKITNASKDGINTLDTPISVDASTIDTVGAHGIIASFLSPANCPALPALCSRLSITGTTVTGAGKDGIVANGLSGQPITVSGNTVKGSGTYGIRLLGADNIKLANNIVKLNGVTANGYPGIYLNGVSGDLTTAITNNTGSGNGLDALVFHGTVTSDLTWITPGGSTLGYMLDGPLTVNGNLSTTGVVKVLAGGIKVNGLLNSVGTIFTSMKENSAPFACNTIFVPGACPTPVLATDFWGGINVDPIGVSHFTGGAIRDATSGLTISTGEIDINGAVISGLTGYAVQTSGTGNAVVTCSGIHNNYGGISANGSNPTTIANSDLYGNTGAGTNLDGTGTTTATNVWWNGTGLNHHPTVVTDYTSTGLTIYNPLDQQPPSAKVSGGSIQFTSDNTNGATGNFGKGTLTVTLKFDRAMSLPSLTTLSVGFAAGAEIGSHPVVVDLTKTGTDPYTWVGHAPIDETALTGLSGANTLTVSGGVSCMPDGSTAMNTETAPFTLDFSTATVEGTQGATNIGARSALLQDRVNPNSWSLGTAPTNQAFAFFQYKLHSDAAYAVDSLAGLQALAANPTGLLGYTVVGNGASPVPVSASISSVTDPAIQPNVAFDYRVIAVDLNGITIGADQHFTTTQDASQLVITDPAPVAGSAVPETITVQDPAGRTVADYVGTVTVSNTDAQATWQRAVHPQPSAGFPATLNFNTADLGSIGLSVTFKTAGSQTLTATATGLTSATQPETVSAGPASALAFTTAPESSTAGISSAIITVQQQDSYGNAVNATAPLAVTLSSNSGTGAFYATDGTTPLINPQAIGLGTSTASFTYRDTKAGTPTLTAKATGLTDGTQQETVTPAAATQLVMGQQPTDRASGQSISPAVTVKVEDQYGNVETGDAGTEHPVTVALATGSPAGPLQGTLTQNDVAGVATFSDLKSTLAGSGYKLEATASGLTLVDSGTFTVTPGSAARLGFTTSAVPTTAGVVTPTITVQQQDLYGNAVNATAPLSVTLNTNSSGTATFYEADRTTPLVNPLIIPTASNSATFAYKDTKAATPTITAQASGLTDGGQVETITPAAANKLVFGTQPSDTAANATIAPSVTVNVEDQFGNVLTTDAGTENPVTLALATGSPAGPLNGTLTANDVNGVATFSDLSVATAGSGYKLEATASGLALADSGAFTIN